MDLLSDPTVVGIATGFGLCLGVVWLTGAVLRTLLSKRYPIPSKGSAVVITGASTGIGNHAAKFLASKGYIVFAGVRKKEDCSNLEALKIPGLRPFIIDVEKPDLIDKAVEHLSSELQKEGLTLTALINNAGTAQKYPVEFHPMPAVRKIFEVHVFGPLYFTQKLLPQLRASKGRVIFMGSFTAQESDWQTTVVDSTIDVTVPLVGAYGGSKNALESLCDAMRLELLEHKVSVTIIEPAYVSSEIFGKVAQVLDNEVQVSEEIMNTYGWFVRPEKRLKDQKAVHKAASPDVTSNTILKALTSPYPQARYTCANVNGVPAGFFLWLHWLVPTPLRDRIVMLMS